MRCSSRLSSSRVRASSAANGSSIKSTDGSWTSARQSDDALLHPAGELVGTTVLEALEPGEREQLLRPRAVCATVEPEDLDGEHHVLDARCATGRSAERWNMNETSRRGRGPAGRRLGPPPPSGSRRPAMMRRSVDFPQPDRPTSVTNSLSPISRSMPSRAWSSRSSASRRRARRPSARSPSSACGSSDHGTTRRCDEDDRVEEERCS